VDRAEEPVIFALAVQNPTATRSAGSSSSKRENSPHLPSSDHVVCCRLVQRLLARCLGASENLLNLSSTVFVAPTAAIANLLSWYVLSAHFVALRSLRSATSKHWPPRIDERLIDPDTFPRAWLAYFRSVLLSSLLQTAPPSALTTTHFSTLSVANLSVLTATHSSNCLSPT